MGQLSRKLRNVQGPALSFWCPGCDGAHGIPVMPGLAIPAYSDTGPRWGWNGNAEKPTFTPSILVSQETWTPPVTPENLDEWKRAPWEQRKVASICHSFVTDGRIQFLSDCTHALAGQTVDLPDWPRLDQEA